MTTNTTGTEMADLMAARRQATKELLRSIQENGGDTPCEADEDLNQAQRRLIDAMRRAYGEVWLGKINRHSDAERTEPVSWKVNEGDTVYTFCSAFALPAHDAKLDELVLARERAPYTGVAGDALLLEPILNRVQEVGGVLLCWS